MAQSVRSVEAVSQLPQPAVGEQAVGYGMFCRIAAVPELQPLAPYDIWRVALEREAVIRVVRSRAAQSGPRWELLAMSDMTEEQLDTYEAAVSDVQEGCPGAGPSLGF